MRIEQARGSDDDIQRVLPSARLRIVARSQAPATIQRTMQFSQLCPTSVVVMVKP